MTPAKRDDDLEEAKRLAVLLEIGARMIDGLSDNTEDQATCRQEAETAMNTVRGNIAAYIAARKRMK